MITYDNTGKIATGHGNDYTTGCLLHYPYFNETCKLIAIDLSKQKALHADPKKIQQINFTGNLDRDGSATIFFIIEEAKKKNILDFSQGKYCKSIVLYCSIESIVNLFSFNIISV